MLTPANYWADESATGSTFTSNGVIMVNDVVRFILNAS